MALIERLVGLASECSRIVTSTKGSTVAHLIRTVRCVP